MEGKRTMHEIPEDIVFDVLARLPAKTLCRLRCVCKGWRAIISDPAFVAAQRSRGGPHLVGVFLGPRNLPEVRVMDMDGNVVKAFDITRSTRRQLATRPELICADEIRVMFRREASDGSTIIDPAAGEAFTAIGTSSYADPSAMSCYTILGRAVPSGLFKVLHHGGGGQKLCEVATIMTGSGGSVRKPLTWRRKPPPPFVIGGCKRQHKAIVNGVAYLIQVLETDGDFDEIDDAAPNFDCIVAFDLESEEWKTEVISGPILEHAKEVADDIRSIALVELNGTLAFVAVVLVNRYPYTSIWLLVDPDKSVWVKEYMIPMPKNHLPVKPLGVLVNGIIILWSSKFEIEKTKDYNTVWQRRREVVLFYDPSTKAFTHSVEMAEEFRFTLVFYTGSLLS